MTDLVGRRLRTKVAGQLDALAATGGPLSAVSDRATAYRPDLFDAATVPSGARRRVHRDIVERYLARQAGVPRHGRAAMLTAGPPGAGKTTVLEAISEVSRWRRLDADIIKTYLLEEALGAGYFDDLLGEPLADGHPIMPAELASLVHVESVMLLDVVRRHCLARGENVVIEGTLAWSQAGTDLLDDLIAHGYSAITIVDVEVPADVAHEGAIARWWAGRQERIATGRGLGGRFTPSDAISRAFPIDGGPSVCLTNARALFDSPAARDIGDFTLTVYDNTGGSPSTMHTYVRHRGRLRQGRG